MSTAADARAQYQKSYTIMHVSDAYGPKIN